MAAKFHISENGMPGKCSAASPDSCPKTQAGDSFHGTLEEATQESQQRFETQLGAFVTASKAEQDAAKKVDAAKAGAGEEVYVHPQGKIIKIDANGNVRAFKDGKELSTSATAEKLREGYGAWKRDDTVADKLPEAAATPAAPAAPAAAPALTAEQQDELVESYDGKIAQAKADFVQTQEDLKKFDADQKAYDSLHAVEEGRAYYYDYSKGYRKINGVNPNGSTSFEPTQEQLDAKTDFRARLRDASQAEEDAQTELERNGLGHRIPDEGNTIRVRTEAQKWLLKDELQGQISDGKWENTSNNPWEDWSNAKVVVDPKNPGRNFRTRKDNYQLNASDLLEVVGDRMVENVQKKTGASNYDDRAMGKDLADLRKIFKTERGKVSGD